MLSPSLGAVAVAAGALDAGLLTHLRLDGGGGSASPNQPGHLSDRDGVTALIGRAAACLLAGEIAFDG